MSAVAGQVVHSGGLELFQLPATPGNIADESNDNQSSEVAGRKIKTVS